jgi:hypothetical protein
MGLSIHQPDPSRARLGAGQHPHRRNARRASFHKGDEDLLAQVSRQFVIVVESPMPIPMSRGNISVHFSDDLDFKQYQKDTISQRHT